MDESGKSGILHRLSREYRTHVLRPGSWTEDDLRQVSGGVVDLGTYMGGPSRFRQQLGRVFLWKVPLRTAMAAMAAPIVDVVYFQGASWGDAREFKWQTVHELAHVWDIFSFYRLSRGLMRATGGKRGRFRWQFPVPFEYEPGGQWLKGRNPPLNALEDWADSAATYVYPSHAESSRPIPRLISPARWDYVREQMQVHLPYPPEWLPQFYGPDGVAPTPE